MVVLDCVRLQLALYVVVDKLHRTWAIERTDGDDVLDAADIKSLAAICNAAAFHLEDAKCFASVVDVEGGPVVAGNEVDVKIRHLCVDESHGFLHDRQRAQAEEVHLQHSQVGERAHGVLGDNLVFLAPAKWDELIERTVADDDASGVDAGIAAQAFEQRGVVPELSHRGLILDGCLKFGIFLARLLEIDAQFVGNHLCHAVTVRVAPTQHTGDIADHTLRAQRAEGDDLRDRTLAVFLAHIFDDLAPALHAEIDINIWRADALGVQEPLKNEPVAERVDIGDSEHIRDQGTRRRAATWTHRNAALPCMADKIPDDQKITDESGFFDHREFIVEPCFQHGVGIHPLAETLAKSCTAEVAQVLLAAARVG